jgi:hypothetical protein
MGSSCPGKAFPPRHGMASRRLSAGTEKNESDLLIRDKLERGVPMERSIVRSRQSRELIAGRSPEGPSR